MLGEVSQIQAFSPMWNLTRKKEEGLTIRGWKWLGEGGRERRDREREREGKQREKRWMEGHGHCTKYTHMELSQGSPLIYIIHKCQLFLKEY
jgi:hypothetical protein